MLSMAAVGDRRIVFIGLVAKELPPSPFKVSTS
jgi:hypothetical protein